jgi:hypothetical protein
VRRSNRIKNKKDKQNLARLPLPFIHLLIKYMSVVCQRDVNDVKFLLQRSGSFLLASLAWLVQLHRNPAAIQL